MREVPEEGGERRWQRKATEAEESIEEGGGQRAGTDPPAGCALPEALSEGSHCGLHAGTVWTWGVLDGAIDR